MYNLTIFFDTYAHPCYNFNKKGRKDGCIMQKHTAGAKQNIEQPLPSFTMSNDKLYFLPLIAETLTRRKIDASHWHDYTQIWYVMGGEMRHNVGGREILQRPGSCVVVLPYTVHSIDTTQSPDDVNILSLSFMDDFLTSRGYEFFSYFNRRARFNKRVIPNFCELEGNSRKRAEEAAVGLLDEFSKHEDMSFDKLARLLSSFLNLLCDELSDNTGFVCTRERANAITKAVRYMGDNLEKKITLDDLCGVAMMSRRMFTENFKAVTGLTSTRYLLSLRLARARFLLTYTDLTTSDIAVESGLTNKVRLAHAFSENIGVTPSEYRRASRPRGIPEDEAYRKKWQWLYDLHPNADFSKLDKYKRFRLEQKSNA